MTDRLPGTPGPPPSEKGEASPRRAAGLPAPVPGALDPEAASALCLAPAPGRMAGVFGPGACAFVLRALARPLLSGEAVVVVDGGNRFDPYAVSRAARELGGDGRAALARLRLSRAFTCHQMEAVLSRRLAPELSRARARLAVVLGPADAFLDEDVPFPEACRLFARSLAALRRIARSGVRVVLAGGDGRVEGPAGSPQTRGLPPGAAPPAEGRAGLLGRLAAGADPLLVLRGEGGAPAGVLRRRSGGGR